MQIVFTKHAEFRFIKRKIGVDEIIDAIKCPDDVLKKNNLYFIRKRLQRGNIEICCEKTANIIKVITVYWV